MPICPRCRQQAESLLRPRYDVTLCAACWDLLLALAAGEADEVDAR